jgi:hypothetical protein
MRVARFMVFVAVGLSLWMPAQAQAQPGHSVAESIDSMVDNADLVVIGKLVRFRAAGQGLERGEHEITIAVEETLKQPLFEEPQEKELVVNVRDPVAVVARWKDRSHRLLVATKQDPPDETTVIDLARDESEVLTADLKLLRNPEDVIRAAKDALRRMPANMKRIHTFELFVPPEIIAGTKLQKRVVEFLELVVPVDERLEKRALNDIASKDYVLREQGVRALRYFKSDENIARVRKLLGDPGWGYLEHPQDNHGIEVRLYGVREEAYRTLKTWGVEVKQPKVEEKIAKLDDVTLEGLSHQKVTAADLRALTRFKNLEILSLLESEFTDNSFPELARFENLKDLMAGGTNIRDQDLKHLAGLKHLRFLDLEGTRITDRGLMELAGFKSLEKVELKNAKVTDAGIAELRKRRPGLVIERSK